MKSNRKNRYLNDLMRMKNRFSRMGKSLLGAMCLLSTCGLTYSCSDDYDLDETMPSFLGGSIYDELKARNFNTVIRLIDDLNYRDVMSQTGSKTIFVTDDDAFARFFATTTWKDGNGNPIRSYDQLSTAQKSILLYGAMLNNADVLEMLPYSSGGGSLTMRRSTQLSAVDSVAYWRWDELPNNLNEPETDAEGNVSGDTRFWDRFRTPARGGIYMALDATSPMMVHFLDEQMQERDIRHSDISFILGNKDPWADGSEGGNRAYIYGNRIVEQDITCMNGYINVLDSVLVTPSNMAEVIRTNGQTNLFSKMLDRFSAPYYNAELTDQYRALHDIGLDSVYEKRYLSSRSQGNEQLSVDFDGNSLGNVPLLTYDPGWNEYAVSSSIPKEQDMGAMFVPTDEAMQEYFVNGGGRVLMERYAKRPNTAENLEYNLYQIPLDILQSLINNLMKDSFLESVPSKYLTIMNDAQDQMFPATNADFATQQNYEGHIVKTLLANNGVVYVLDRVITPADYASVIAPALYSANTTVVRAVVRADDNYIEGTSYNSAPLKKYYSTYLKAMQSRFSFFVPTDDGLSTYGYVDPMSLSKNIAQASQYKYWRFVYRNAPGAVLPIRAEAYRYNMETGQNPETDVRQTAGGTNNNQSDPTGSLTTGAGLTKRTLLIDMIDQHIVVHDTEDADNDQGVNARRKYFTSRGGAPVYVKDRGNIEDNNVGMKVDGGFQIQLNQDQYPDNDHDCTVTEGYDMTQESNGYGNGKTYLLDRPMQPTTRSVWNVFTNNPDNYSEFFQLCQASFPESDLKAAGLDEGVDEADWASEQNKYRIFTASGMNPAANEQLVRFFNNYRYTIYAPTNAAIQEAISRGLPTYDDIHNFIETNNLGEDEDGNPTLSPENQAKAQAMITMLINFLKYHFQDGAYYVDDVDNENDYQTSCIDNVNNVYLSIHVKQSPNTLTVTDNNGLTQSVVEPYNVLARDMNFNSNTSAVPTSFQYSSYVVIHQVNHVLDFARLSATGRYDDAWATASQAKAFTAKYRIRK